MGGDKTPRRVRRTGADNHLFVSSGVWEADDVTSADRPDRDRR